MAARARVLYVVDSLEIGGVREMVLSDLRSLDRGRFEVGLLTLAGDVERVAEDLPGDVASLSVRYRGAYRYGALAYAADGLLWYGARRFGRLPLAEIRSFRPQILHFHTNPRDLGLGILASRRSGAELIFTDHLLRVGAGEYSPHARLVLLSAYRRLYKHCHLVAVGSAVARFHRDARMLDASKMHLELENEVDIVRFQPPPRERPPAPVEIVQVARINAVKGTETVLRAFGKLRPSNNVKLTLVGPDGLDGAMQRLAREVVPDGLEVRFVGARSDVPDLLRAASIGVLVSRREGFPLVVLEMMASGLPVVVSDIPELEGVVTDGVDGLVVPVDDVDAVAAALQRLAGDAELRQRLGREARRSAERRMTGDRIPKLEAFYEKLAAHS